MMPSATRKLRDRMFERLQAAIEECELRFARVERLVVEVDEARATIERLQAALNAEKIANVNLAIDLAVLATALSSKPRTHDY